MNAREVDSDEYAAILRTATVLDTWHLPNGSTFLVAHHAGTDCFFFHDSANGASLVIDADDHLYGGSTHQHIRDARNLGTF